MEFVSFLFLSLVLEPVTSVAQVPLEVLVSPYKGRFEPNNPSVPDKQVDLG